MSRDREAGEELKRESIWSVREADRPKFAHYFIVLFFLGLAFSVWYEIFRVVDDSIFDSIAALIRDIGLVGIAAVTLTFARFEGEDSMGVALEVFKKRRFEEGRAVGIEEGRAERDALRKRIAELESKNGNSPGDSRPPSHSDENDE